MKISIHTSKQKILLLAAMQLALSYSFHGKDEVSINIPGIYNSELASLPTTRVIAFYAHSTTGLSIDPRKPAQPIPAQDGAELLRTIPGFNLIRKGGTDGDPTFRGMAGSRLGILLEGELILGGCGNRMDPPTAYVFPSAYDRVTFIRGPQSVRYGAGNSAGTVLFERDPRRFEVPSAEWLSQLTFGSFGRNDQLIDTAVGNARVDARFSATRSAADDYKDGSGQRVHSQYERWSLHGTLGWNVHTAHRLELGGILSDGEAAYADRSMDGTVFERENLSFRWQFTNPHAGALRTVDAQLYYNYIDHVMDNFSLRTFTPTPMMPNRTVSNPDRRTMGGRIESKWQTTDSWEAITGVDWQSNTHTTRRTMNASVNPVENLPRITDARFRGIGWFAENTVQTTDQQRWVSGIRVDFHRSNDERLSVPIGMMMPPQPNPTANQRRSETLPSGFLRWEYEPSQVWLFSLGLGHSQRFPDYWELFNKESAGSISAFAIKPEKVTQLDLGMIRRVESLEYSLNLFANRIDDYILIESQVPKGMRMATISRNVDAETYGGELAAQYAIDDNWKLSSSLAYVRGRNRTDGLPLAQQPPLEGRLGIVYQEEKWSFGSLLRLVDRQHRFALNQGNIVGQDLGRSSGFVVFSLHGNLQLSARNRLSAGVDNLFDKSYAEHLSRGGSSVAGFPPPTTRVNEPGRNIWVQWQFSY
jgi:iron complex outermembrane receptor protein